MTGESEAIHKPMASAAECNLRKRTLMTETYFAAFRAMVDFINGLHPFEELDKDNYKTLMLVDFPGYDSLKENHLDQLLINFGNEKFFENLFINHTSEKECKLFETEGQRRIAKEFRMDPVAANLVKYFENQEGLGGFFKFLSSVSQSSRMESQWNECYKSFCRDFIAQKNKQHLSEVFLQNAKEKGEMKGVINTFILGHSFYPVTYQTSDLLLDDRNTKLEPYFLDVLKKKNEGMSKIFEAYRTWIKDSKKHESLGQQFNFEFNQFQQQVSAAGGLNFVFNIRFETPDNPDEFNQTIVIPQLQKLGVVKYLNKRKEYFPVRIGFKEFCSKFMIMCLKVNEFFLELNTKNFKEWRKLTTE